jgi:hypothetical protein
MNTTPAPVRGMVPGGDPISRRRAVPFAGALALALAGGPASAAKKPKKSKKSKQRCQRQVVPCRAKVSAIIEEICAGFEDEKTCKEEYQVFLDCCDFFATCNATEAVACFFPVT